MQKAISDYSAKFKFCFEEFNVPNIGESALKVIKIKNQVKKAPVNTPLHIKISSMYRKRIQNQFQSSNQT